MAQWFDLARISILRLVEKIKICFAHSLYRYQRAKNPPTDLVLACTLYNSQASLDRKGFKDLVGLQEHQRASFEPFALDTTLRAWHLVQPVISFEEKLQSSG